MGKTTEISREDREAWHHLRSPAGGPFYYGLLTDAQRQVLRDWLTDTGARDMVGEASASAHELPAGLLPGNHTDLRNLR